MTDTEIQIPPLPPALDPTRLYSPSEVRQWKRDTEAHYDAKRAAQRQQVLRDEVATSPRMLSEEEDFALALERQATRTAQQFERDSQALMQKKAQEAYLASSPETAEVIERSFVRFLVQFQLWAQRGYVVNVDGPLTGSFDLYHATLTKPAQTSKVAK
jgi:hypothetical protein